MTHKVGLVTYGSAIHAWVLDLPGCITGGRDRAELDEKLPLVIEEYLGWLRHHGEDIAISSEWHAVETIDGEALAATGGEFCFEADLAELSAADLVRDVARMTYARDDLLAAVVPVPDSMLNSAPPNSAFATASLDAWAPEARTIRGILEHVLQLEIYYQDGLRDGPSRGIFERVGDPAAERARTIELLRTFDDSARNRSYMPVRPGRTTPEAWTVRKAIRRIISHDRAHTAEIVQRRTWLLLGIPSFS